VDVPDVRQTVDVKTLSGLFTNSPRIRADKNVWKNNKNNNNNSEKET
jgi:hypothetical protein